MNASSTEGGEEGGSHQPRQQGSGPDSGLCGSLLVQLSRARLGIGEVVLEDDPRFPDVP